MPVRDATKPGQDLAWWWNVVQWTVTRRVVSTRDRGDTEIQFIFCCPQFQVLNNFHNLLHPSSSCRSRSGMAQFCYIFSLPSTPGTYWLSYVVGNDDMHHCLIFNSIMDLHRREAQFYVLQVVEIRVPSICNIENAQVFFRELRFFQSRVWKSSKSFWGVAEGSSPLITGYHGLRECWFFNFLRTDRSLADWTQLMSTTNYRADDVESEYVARGLCMFTWGCFASYHLHNGAMSEKADGFLEKPQPGFFSWIGPAFKSRRTMKTWFRCCVALTATLVLMVDKKTSLNMGQASFFAAYVFWISNFTRLTGR